MKPIYIPNFVSKPDEVFNRLYNDLNWKRHNSKPRREYYCNDHPVPYTYGRGEFATTYHPEPYSEDILAIRHLLEKELDTVLDVCFLNCYEDYADHLGWHADDGEEMDPDRPIVTVSFGAERYIWFKEMKGTEVDKILLEKGSACIMPAGMQKTHFHRIPKHDRPCGPRISLTYRGYKAP